MSNTLPPTSAAAAVNVICMKWGSKYPADYVNRLYAMVRRNLTLPHRFVCFTDNAADIRAEVEIKPIPELKLPDDTPERGWLKIAILQNPLADLTGQALFLDLDLVIVDNIDDFFRASGAFRIAQNKRGGGEGNSSVFRFEVGRYAAVLDDFRQNFHRIKTEVRREQQYLTREIRRAGDFQFWQDGWAVSFKYRCCPSWVRSWRQAPFIPPGAKIIYFHGLPNPPEALRGISGKWYRRIQPAAWIADHWRE